MSTTIGYQDNMETTKTQAKQKAKETIEIIERGYKTERRIHPGYTEWINIKEKMKNKQGQKIKMRQYFGKYQYHFTKGDLRISMIKILDTIPSTKWIWEIHAFEDKRLFEDVRKFPTKKAAMKAVDGYLRG